MENFNGSQVGTGIGSSRGNNRKPRVEAQVDRAQAYQWPVTDLGNVTEIVADPNDLIDSIVDAIDYAELARDDQGLIKARRLLKNDLRQAIDLYVQDEVSKALDQLDGQQSQGRRV